MKKIDLHILNTIWSDCMILSKDNHHGFIDTASAFYLPDVMYLIDELKIKELDFIIITHWHHDHYGNAEEIIKKIPVKTLYLKHYHGVDGSTSAGFESNEDYLENERNQYNNLIKAAKERNVNIIYLDDLNNYEYTIDFYGQDIELYDLKNRLWLTYNDPRSPYYHEYHFNQNYNSIGIFLKINDLNVFLGGDLSAAKLVLEDYSQLSIKIINRIYEKHHIDHIDFYKACHHGCGGSPLTLTNLMKARFVVITNSPRWLDNYDTIPNLKEANKDIKIFITDYHLYHFSFDKDITYQDEYKESLFITLNKT